MWDAFTLSMPVREKVLRTLVIYIAISLLVRLAGKRGLAQLNSFDLVVVLLLSNVVQNAIIGDDNSLTGGLIGAVVLVAVNASTALRAQNADEVAEVERASLEPGGALVVTLFPERRNADRSDIDTLHHRLDELEHRVLGALERRA